jgi:hypothetical protein
MTKRALLYPWFALLLTLCMLNEIRAAHGWQTYTSFFSAMNATTNEQIPPAGNDVDPASDAAAWGFVRDRLSQAAGADVSPILRRWKVPLPTP